MPILRDNLLAGRRVAGNVSSELRDVLTALGADLAEPGQATDALVHDARDEFGDGGPAALQMALEATWEAVAQTASTALIPSGRGGKIILIAPEDAAGIHAAPARAVAVVGRLRRRLEHALGAHQAPELCVHRGIAHARTRLVPAGTRRIVLTR